MTCNVVLWKVACQCAVLLCFLSDFIPLASSLERKITSEINPGCQLPRCNDTSFTVVYVKAEGTNDTLHYVWDLTKKPSILLALTSSNTVLSINWTSFVAGERNALNFSLPVTYSFGIVIDRISEYNDVNDTGCFDTTNKTDAYVRTLDTSHFLWKRVQYKNDSERVVLNVESELSDDNSTKKNGTLRMELSGFGFLDHSEVLPHLLHTANSTQVDIVFDGLTTDSNFSSSRFAVELVIVSSEQANNTIKINVRKSLDDEHTPGVFTLVDVETPSSVASSSGGYLQWRPVAYVSEYRDISNSTDTNVYGIASVTNTSNYLQNSILYSYYNVNDANILVQSTAVSFGLKEDGFYKGTNYTSWTFSMGYGKPPDEDFSLLVILVISIGLGLPALLIIISGIVMAVRRISQKKDDLFLSR